MLPIALVTALISAGGLVLGSVIGAICSIFINKVSLHEQVKIQRENLNYQENCSAREKYINANIIRLDFCNAIYQSVRSLQKMDSYEVSYSIPMYKDYHKIIASLCGEYSLKELSYIYQFYGVLEMNSKKIESLNSKDLNDRIIVQNSFKNILIKLYGENYIKLLSKNIDCLSFNELYSDSLMKKGYRDILKSLDVICNMGYKGKRMT
ncbi:hypothetical protein [Clostridium sp. 1001271B_151109_B4]|uniref:hypothetical protein n=1 Tax=Clostridium sp. 1001271B_151109_B4 TaxID=2787148 RepID=UPI0018A9AF23|nr:hypothetical protein [Clostridium sp. 1001271B_151109_B4]